VMSMDALIYAYAKPGIRSASAALGAPTPRTLPFNGYITPEETALLGQNPGGVPEQQRKQRLNELVAADWVKDVDTFVTLGSPIDKYLVIWWLNYQHLLDTSWMDPARINTSPARQKIRHFNYAEAQDPVGDNLDVARTAAAFDAVFENVEDKIYTRYAVPGVAHVQYWHDQDLFNRIVARTVDARLGRPLPPIRWFCGDVYKWILLISYWAIPIAVVAVNVVVFFFAYNAASWYAEMIPAALLFGAWLLSRYLIDLTMWWRQILKAKVPVEASVRVTHPDHLTAMPAAMKSKLVWDRTSTMLYAANLDSQDAQPGGEEIAELAKKSKKLRKQNTPSVPRDVLYFLISVVSCGWLPRRGDVKTEEGCQRYQNIQEACFRGAQAVCLFTLSVVGGFCSALYLDHWWRYRHPAPNAWPVNWLSLVIIGVVFVVGSYAWSRLLCSE